MKAIDLQTQMTTQKGALFPKSVASMFEQIFKTKIPYYQTEQQMVDVWRNAGVKVVLCPPTAGKTRFEEIQDINNYVAELRDDYPDTILGSWIMPNLFRPPRNWDEGKWRDSWLEEMERCIKDLKFFGFFYYGAAQGVGANDPRLYPFYKLCARYRVPVKISVGHTALGAGLPGGGGIKLRTENPIPYIDDVAADFPNLNIIASHFPWPFHHEMASVLIHKANVYNEVHGWSPKYFPQDFKHEINTRLKNKIMFGSDWPFFSYERLFQDWESQGYDPEVLQNIYINNAQRVLRLKL